MSPLDDNDEWETTTEHLDYLMAEIFLPTAQIEQSVKEILDLVMRDYHV